MSTPSAAIVRARYASRSEHHLQAVQSSCLASKVFPALRNLGMYYSAIESIQA